jgi:putative transcriptional regulator
VWQITEGSPTTLLRHLEFLLPGTVGMPFLDRDEGFCAGTKRQILSSIHGYVHGQSGINRIYPICNTIRRPRTQECLPRQGLVDLISVLRQTVASMEGGKSSFSLELAFRIAQVFRVPLEESFEFVSCSA